MLIDYKGTCHIHTEYPNGSISVSDVIKSAQDAGLDFVILSDHNAFMLKRDGWEGWYDNLLITLQAWRFCFGETETFWFLITDAFRQP